jgi:glycosyltransferase involved in cell wall biosynthesis
LKYKLLLHPLTKTAARTTVVSTKLRARYGGTLVLHGPDEAKFDPTPLDVNVCRDFFHLPGDRQLAVFAGVPHPHKGLRELVEALHHASNQCYHLVYAGPPDHPEARLAFESLGARFHGLGLIENSRMPSLLAAIDVVPIPQLSTPFAEAQVPAKLLEAMAMARAIISTRVSDIASLLGEGTGEPRGWVVQPGDVPALAEALATAAREPEQRRRRGSAARRFFLAEASVAAIQRKIELNLATTRL